VIDILGQVEDDIGNGYQQVAKYHQHDGSVGYGNASEHEEKRHQEQQVEMSPPQEGTAAPGFAIGVVAECDPAEIGEQHDKKRPFELAGLRQLAPVEGQVDGRAENQQRKPGLGGIGIARQHDHEQREQGGHRQAEQLASGGG